MAQQPQNYANHARFFPMFHVGVLVPFAANFFWAAYKLTRGVSGDSVMALVMAIALILLALASRVQALTVQDRVIRLEMRLRLREVLPADLKARIGDLTLRQLVGLRFASDAQLPELVREVLGGQLTEEKAIKQKVTDWQADFLRA